MTSSKRMNSSGVIDQVREQAAEVTTLVRSGARAAGKQASRKLSEMTRSLKDEAQRMVDEQKDWAAAEIETVSNAIHEAARKLQDGQIDFIAEYVDSAAERLEAISKYLEAHDVGEMLEGVTDVVRRHPMAFIGGFLLAGIALGRFVKAGDPPPVPTPPAPRGEGQRGRNGSGSARGRGGTQQGRRRRVAT